MKHESFTKQMGVKKRTKHHFYTEIAPDFITRY